MTNTSLVHTETLQLAASAKQIHEFIMTPKRILDYYPGGIDGGILESGNAIYCRGKSGVSLLECITEESNQHKTVVKVTVASNIKPPYSKSRIEEAVLFTMYEDWEIVENPKGSLLTKTWRDLHKHKMKFLPMKWIVRNSAKKESKVLIEAWNRAADGQ